MICPYCQAEIRDGSKFCTECGAPMAQPQQQRQVAAVAAGGGLMLGAAARQARREAVYSPDQIVSDRVYNGILLGVVLYGLLVNVLLCAFVGDVFEAVNPVVFIIGYVVLSFAGIIVAGKSQNPWISFLGYNMVVLPFGLMISAVVAGYGGLESEIVTYAFLYTMVISLGMAGAALAFPKLFSKLGGALLGCLFGLLLCEIVMLIFGVDQVISDWIAAGIFSLYIGYDVWRSQQFAKTVDNAVDCALDIYLDIANLFIRLLQILAKREK
jgi:FtsH-binding integral membrane protein